MNHDRGRPLPIEYVDQVRALVQNGWTAMGIAAFLGVETRAVEQLK